MGVHAEARGLHRPLSGGEANATVSVEPLLGGEVDGPPGWFESTPGRLATLRSLGVGVPRSRWWRVPVPTYLIRHPTAGPILVDTGLHPSIATDPKQNLGRAVSFAMSSHLEAERALPRQLRDRGVDPRDLGLVVLTHLHWDHASGISSFPDATFVLSEAEWVAATEAKRPLLEGYRHQMFDFAFDYRTVDFSRGSVASHSTFGRTFDLLADGSVRLAFTPGHTAGHVSVICRLAERELVICGDAIYTMGQLDGAPEPARTADRHRWRRSVNEIRRFREQHPDAVILAGHDPDQWPTLAERYE